MQQQGDSKPGGESIGTKMAIQDQARGKRARGIKIKCKRRYWQSQSKIGFKSNALQSMTGGFLLQGIKWGWKEAAP